MTSAKEKLIIALDVDRSDRALELFETLRDVAGMFKIGSQLFTAVGPEIVRQIIARGGQVFLDLKFHDIPNTVATAGIQATRLGVSIFNVHASGGIEMMKRTAEAVAETASREALSKPAVIAVTALTSLDSRALDQIGIRTELHSFVTKLARAAFVSGLEGVVASPQETAIIRQEVNDADFLVIAPGIRPHNSTSDDQCRVMTPSEAIHAGVNFIVVGRPILNAANPVEAARKVIDEIETALGDH